LSEDAESQAILLFETRNLATTNNAPQLGAHNSGLWHMLCLHSLQVSTIT